MTEDPGRHLAALIPEALQDPASSAPEPTYRKILVGADGTEGAAHALAWAGAFAEKASVELHIATVVAPMPSLFDPDQAASGGMPQTFQAMQDAETEAAERIAAEAVRTLKEAGHEATPHIVHGAPVRALAELAHKVGADLVMVGAHAEGTLGRLVLGSVSDGIKDQAECDVLIAKASPPPAKVMMAADGSPSAHAAVLQGTALAALFEAPAEAVHVFEAPRLHHPEHGASYYTQFRDRCKVMAEAAESMTFGGGLRLRLRVGEAARDLVTEAKERDAGLIVTGTRSRGTITSLLLGSVSRKVAHTAPCSVLLIRGETTGRGSSS